MLPAHRQQGFGALLVNHVLSAAGAGAVSVGIIADHNELREWYLRRGFTETDTGAFAHLPFAVGSLEYSLHE